jgi:DNA modification methylase
MNLGNFQMSFNVEMWAVDRPKPYEKNPRMISPEAIQKTARSIKEYGWRQPIVVDENDEILVGHTRLLAAKSLGAEEVPVHVAEGLNEKQKRGYRIADNRTGTETQWDFPMLTTELEWLNDAEFDLTLTAFDPGEINGFLSYDENENPYDAYADGEKGSMASNFGAPPFSVLDTRQKYWQDRKEWWNARIGDQGESRENTLAAKGSVMEGIGSVSLLDASLAEIICRWFGAEDFHTFDCFAGDTVFGYVCASLGMDFTGIELREEQARLNNERVARDELSARYINDDAMNMDRHIQDESMDLFFSCPPYADLEVYSDNPNDLSNMSHDEFFKVYKTCLQNTYKKLKPNRFAIVTIGDVRSKKGGYISLVPETVRFMVEAGYQYWNEIILVNAAGTLPLRAGKSMNASRKVGKTHQNILVFYKGDPKKIKEEFGDVRGGFREDEEADE